MPLCVAFVGHVATSFARYCCVDSHLEIIIWTCDADANADRSLCQQWQMRAKGAVKVSVTLVIVRQSLGECGGMSTL